MTDISYANASFYGCSFASYQDTWYTGRNASTYVVDSIIFGMTDCESLPHVPMTPFTDSMFRSFRLWYCVCSNDCIIQCAWTDELKSWFQNVILANRGCGGGIVAWKGTNFTGPSPIAPGNRYGAYIANSRIIRVSRALEPERITGDKTDGL